LEIAMPIALVLVLLDILLVYHAAKTGRLQPWAFIILMVPGIGAVAYVVVELLPGRCALGWPENCSYFLLIAERGFSVSSDGRYDAHA
jgi:hypothetical protein